MFRLTMMTDDGQTVHLKAEGRVVGDWVSELDRACGSCLSQGKQVILDLSEVTYIDRRGVDALKGVLGIGVQIKGGNLLIQALLGREPAGKAEAKPGGKPCSVDDATA